MALPTRALPTLLAALAAAGCVLPLDAGPNVGQPPAPTPAPIAPVVAGVPVGSPAAGAATTLRAKQASLELTLGEDRPLAALVVDGSGLVQTTGVTWLSSNPAVLTINPTSGQARALSAGSAVVIAASQANPAAQAQIEVRVTEPQLVKQIVVDPASPRLADGEQVSLTAQVFMSDGTINGNVRWASSDERIATVTASGEVRARKEGKVTIEAIYAPDPRFKGIAVLTIGDPPPMPAGPATGPGDVTPGSLPGEQVITTGPRGKWIAQLLPEITAISGVWFRDPQHGLLVAGNGWFATADAGGAWTQVAPAQAGAAPQDLDWFDADTLVATNHAGVLRSTDGGATWTATRFELPAQPRYTTPIVASTHVVGPAEAYALVSDLEPYRYFANVVYHTTDKGETWTKETWAEMAKQHVVAIARVGDARVALTSGGVYRTGAAEGGWTKLELPLRANLTIGPTATGALAVVPGTATLFAADATYLMRSDDAGQTWAKVPGAAGGPHTLSFADAEHGLAVGPNAALTTNDGGKTWHPGDEVAKSTAVRDGSRLRTGARLSADRGYVVSHDNKLYRFVYP